MKDKVQSASNGISCEEILEYLKSGIDADTVEFLKSRCLPNDEIDWRECGAIYQRMMQAFKDCSRKAAESSEN